MARSAAVLLSLGLWAGASVAAPIVFEDTNTSQLGTIDLGTGQFTSIGTTKDGGTTVLLTGLGAGTDGRLYAGAFNSASFYRINTSTAALSLVGTSNVTFFDTGSTSSGVFAVNRDGTNNMNLFSINTTTGQGTLLGATGLTYAGGFIGLSSGGGTLYLSNATNLYSLNTSTGAATLVGSTTGSKQYGAMISVGGTLFGGEITPASSVDTFNTTTGAATGGPAVSGTADQFFGLALPEPVCGAMLMLGAMPLMRRRRRS